MDGLLNFILFLAVGSAVALLLKPALPQLRGRFGEWLVHRRLRRSLPASHYRVFHDVTLRGNSGAQPQTTQIDHVVVSPYGVFVIETRHCSGWIVGSEHAAQWTRTRYRSKSRFQNPLRQSHVHVRALQELLGLAAGHFHSLVVFTGSAEFKNPMPVQVTRLGGMVPFIQVRTRESLGFDEAERVARLIESSRLAPGVQTRAAHLAALRAAHGSRFNAKQALVGLGLMAAMLFVAGGMIQRLAELPGQYPARAVPQHSPFVDHAPPPRIDLPAVAGPQRSGDSAGATEESPMCTYSTESRRCACYAPQGRKAEIRFDVCMALADQ
jgi:restriction system protein